MSAETQPEDLATAAEETEVVNDAEESTPAEPWTQERVQGAVEALLFASPDVLPFRAIRGIIPEEEVATAMIKDALAALTKIYDEPGRGVVLAEIAGGWQFQTHEDQFKWVQSLAKTRKEDRITPATLETLAIIAYKQPITRAEIDAVRGVGSGQMIRTLMEKKMVKVAGRVDLPGRPFLYGTTPHFLEHFGLGSLRDLPQGREL